MIYYSNLELLFTSEFWYLISIWRIKLCEHVYVYLYRTDRIFNRIFHILIINTIKKPSKLSIHAKMLRMFSFNDLL